MSHTLNSNISPHGALRVVNTTIVNYTSGGETYTLAELGVQAIDGVFFAVCGPAQNSLGKALMPVLIAGKVMLIQSTTTGLSEIPTTAAINAAVVALVATH